MPQSHAQVWLHVVFSTKHRQTFLEDEEFRQQMFRMLAFHVHELGCVSASVGGYVDHVHLLIGLSRTRTIAGVVEHLKTETSKWAKTVTGVSTAFHWQKGYGAFSVSHSLRNNVDHYIRNQSEHHRKMTFQEEYRIICARHGLEIDERYVWD